MNENAGWRGDPTLDSPMILFQYIVKVLYRSMPAILLQSVLGFELYDGWWITGVFVGVDYARRRMVLSAQGEKALSRSCVAFMRYCTGRCRQFSSRASSALSLTMAGE